MSDVRCTACGQSNPELAQFCLRCGDALSRAGGGERRAGRSYAVHASESVAQLSLITTLLPHSNRKLANDYRWALATSIGLIAVAALLGLPAAAMVAGAFLLPVLLLVYLLDVGLWDLRPGPVAAALCVVPGAGALLVAGLLMGRVFGSRLGSLLFTAGHGGGLAAVPIGGLLLFAVALPVLGEVAKQIGPVLLSRRPQFDDMIDGFTFGLVSGACYAAVETLALFAPVFAATAVHGTDGATLWLVVVLNVAIVKPVVQGSATGIAVASFSGRGTGYVGFGSDYLQHVVFAAGVNVAYWLGIRLLALLPFGAALGLIWGLLLATGLLIRVRVILHQALLETALEQAAGNVRAPWSTTVAAYCPECSNVLLPDSSFCVVCGSSVRATSVRGRRHIRDESPAAPATGKERR